MINKKYKFNKKARLITFKSIIIMILSSVMLFISGVCVQANSVEYRGEVDGLIATPEDFFTDFGTLMPGDKREGKAYIKNITNDEIEVFFKTEPLNTSEYYDDIDYSLLEKISLTIILKHHSEEKVLYTGNLGAESMSEFISLGKYNEGFDGEFIFRIEVPTSLNNNYTLSRTKVKWIFAVEKKDEEQHKPDDNPEKNQDKEKSDDNSKDKKDTKENKDTKEEKNPVEKIINQVQTGDKMYYVVGILVIAVLIYITIFVSRKKGGGK